MPLFHGKSMNKPCRSAMALFRAPGIDNQQAPPWFEHAGYLSESLTLEVVSQLVRHQGREHDIERWVGERELLDHTELEVDRAVAPSCDASDTSDHLHRGVNTTHALSGLHRQHSGATPYIPGQLSTFTLEHVHLLREPLLRPSDPLDISQILYYYILIK